MSIVVTRSPLEQIGMNIQKRRSARLSQENEADNEYPAKKSKVNGAATTAAVGNDGETKGGRRKKSKSTLYDEKVDGFAFTKKRKPAIKEPEVQSTTTLPQEERFVASSTEVPVPANAPDRDLAPAVAPTPAEEPVLEIPRKKTRRRLPTTPERDVGEKTVRRSKRLSNELAAQTSPKAADGAKLQNMPDRSPTPDWVQPVTVEKKRKKVGDSVEEEKTKRFVLSFNDTPIIQRNQQMRKGSREGRRRSSSGMRGRRASSLIDEGRGNALPHPEVPTEEFFKHISAELTEPRRMRCLIGWCGTRTLPAKPDPPKENTPAAKLEFRALQTAHMILEELSQDLASNGTLSDWFGRDDSQPLPKPLRKKPNPRNTANAVKVKELERELERLKREKTEWDEIINSAPPLESPQAQRSVSDGQLSPLRTDLLDSPQRAIIERLQGSNAGSSIEAAGIERRLRGVAENLEYTVDLFALGVHTLNTARNAAELVADRTLANAAHVLEEREKQRAESGKSVDQMDALRGLAKVLNAQYRRP